MQIMVMDLEATCFEPSVQEQGRQEAILRSEIIEFGYSIVVLDDLTKEYVLTGDGVSVPIKPRLSYVSQFCTELTGWTAKELDDVGMGINAAWDHIKDVWRTPLTRFRVWVSWGMYDYNMMMEESDRLGRAMPLPRPFHLNLKTLYAVMRGVKPMSVGAALEREGIEFVGRPHRGADDAYNSAVLFCKLMNENVEARR